jgi:hypothetical protein
MKAVGPDSVSGGTAPSPSPLRVIALRDRYSAYGRAHSRLSSARVSTGRTSDRGHSRWVVRYPLRHVAAAGLKPAPRGMPARRPLLASQPSGIPARGFLHARTVFPRARLPALPDRLPARVHGFSVNVGPEAPYASWACQPAPATFAGYAQAYFQPASLRFFSHTPNTPNCATQ